MLKYEIRKKIQRKKEKAIKRMRIKFDNKKTEGGQNCKKNI
jgi:hypothetical protein